MKKLILLALVLAPLASCEYLRSWAASQEPQTPPADPDVPVPPSQLPQVGGGDPLDLIATVLALLGLAPAARLVTMARPFLAALIITIVGKKKSSIATPTTTPTVS